MGLTAVTNGQRVLVGQLEAFGSVIMMKKLPTVPEKFLKV